MHKVKLPLNIPILEALPLNAPKYGIFRGTLLKIPLKIASLVAHLSKDSFIMCLNGKCP